MKPYDVIVFGDTAVDLVLTNDDIVPRFGQVEKLIENYSLELGGSCCIFASQAAKLGLNVGIIGRVGDDAFGHFVIQKLQNAGVDTQHMVIDPSLKTGLTVALTQQQDRAMLTYLGSLSSLTPDDITDEYLSSGRHLHYGSLFIHAQLRPHWVDIIRRARSSGASVSVDTNWDPDETWDANLTDAFPYIDIMMPNEQEAQYLSGKSDLDDAITYFREHVPILTLKLGEKGAKLFEDTTSIDCKVPPAESGGDSIGAGDSFDAGFIAAWLRGLSLQDCLDVACQCGRSVASQVGGTDGQPYEHDISQFQSTRI